VTGRRRQRRGQALVEFALILPIFILVLLGLFDGARAVYALSTVGNVARTAVRQAIVDQTPATVRDAGRGVASGINVGIDPVPCSEAACMYQVTVRCRYEPMTPLLSSIFSPTLTSTVSMEIEVKNPETPQTTPVTEGTPAC
jgi:Flp pilus assembly protein TadG